MGRLAEVALIPLAATSSQTPWIPLGKPFFAYNPPWRSETMRRNEVWRRVAK